jgi:hypothetical protein
MPHRTLQAVRAIDICGQRKEHERALYIQTEEHRGGSHRVVHDSSISDSVLAISIVVVCIYYGPPAKGEAPPQLKGLREFETDRP